MARPPLFPHFVVIVMSYLDPKIIASALGGDVRGERVLAPGPGHSPADRSLAIKFDEHAPEGFLVHSFAGDDPIACRDYIREKCQLPEFRPNGNGRRRTTRSDLDELFRAAAKIQIEEKPRGGRLVAQYGYTDESGATLYEVLKYEPKNFRQRQPDGNGGWTWNLDGVRRVPYRLPDLLKYPTGTIFVCEGEKDADRVASLGLCATAAASGKWTEEIVKIFAGRDVVILQDNDEPGRKKALAAAHALHGVAWTIQSSFCPSCRTVATSRTGWTQTRAALRNSPAFALTRRCGSRRRRTTQSRNPTTSRSTPRTGQDHSRAPAFCSRGWTACNRNPSNGYGRDTSPAAS